MEFSTSSWAEELQVSHSTIIFRSVRQHTGTKMQGESMLPIQTIASLRPLPPDGTASPTLSASSRSRQYASAGGEWCFFDCHLCVDPRLSLHGLSLSRITALLLLVCFLCCLFRSFSFLSTLAKLPCSLYVDCTYVFPFSCLLYCASLYVSCVCFLADLTINSHMYMCACMCRRRCMSGPFPCMRMMYWCWSVCVWPNILKATIGNNIHLHLCVRN